MCCWKLWFSLVVWLEKSVGKGLVGLKEEFCMSEIVSDVGVNLYHYDN